MPWWAWVSKGVGAWSRRMISGVGALVVLVMVAIVEPVASSREAKVGVVREGLDFVFAQRFRKWASWCADVVL